MEVYLTLKPQSLIIRRTITIFSMITVKDFRLKHQLSQSGFNRACRRAKAVFPKTELVKRLGSTTWEVLEVEILESYLPFRKRQGDTVTDFKIRHNLSDSQFKRLRILAEKTLGESVTEQVGSTTWRVTNEQALLDALAKYNNGSLLKLGDSEILNSPFENIPIPPESISVNSTSDSKTLLQDLKTGRLDFPGIYLQNKDLRGLNLEKIILRDANLRGSDLRGCNLRFADLKGADLRETKLTGANLDFSDLTYSNFKDSELSFSTIRHSIVCYVDFKQSVLKNVDFTNSDLTGGDFRGCDISTVVFDYAECQDMQS